MAAEEPSSRLNWGLTPIAWDGTRTPLKTTLFLVVCVTWLLPGLVGHDPWKYDEAVVFGIVTEILRTGDWITFRIAGEPFFGKAPLFVWTAALLAKAMGGVLTLHDAARLAAGVYMALTMLFVSRAGHELVGERGIRVSVLLLIGCLGLLIRAHEMTSDLAGLTGVAMALYGVALAHRRPYAGGAIAGAAIGVAFLGNGFLPAGMIVFMLALLPAMSPAWRNGRYAATVAMAIAVAAPLVASWLLALSASGPANLHTWLENAMASRWTDKQLHDPLEIFYFARLLPWYAWPAWPLAAAARPAGRGGARFPPARRGERPRLVRHDDVPVARGAAVDRLLRGDHRRAGIRRHADLQGSARIQVPVQLPVVRPRRAAHAHLDRGRGALAALHAARDRELERGDHDVVDADDDARLAAGRPGAQLSRGSGAHRDAAAGIVRLHRPGERGRCATRRRAPQSPPPARSSA